MTGLRRILGSHTRGARGVSSGVFELKAEAHRITCTKGHTLAVTKSGDDDVEAGVIRHYGKCLYCGGALQAQPTTINDYESWSSRADGRFEGSGAP